LRLRERRVPNLVDGRRRYAQIDERLRQFHLIYRDRHRKRAV
jgi:hypothetical protein